LRVQTEVGTLSHAQQGATPSSPCSSSSSSSRSRVDKELCVCVGEETQVLSVLRPDGVFAAEALPKITMTAGQVAVCHQAPAALSYLVLRPS